MKNPQQGGLAKELRTKTKYKKTSTAKMPAPMGPTNRGPLLDQEAEIPVASMLVRRFFSIEGAQTTAQTFAAIRRWNEKKHLDFVGKQRRWSDMEVFETLNERRSAPPPAAAAE